MFDPILNRFQKDGYESMDIDKNLTISDCCNKYKNRLDYNIQIANYLYKNPLCGLVKELVILTTETDKRIFKKVNSKTSSGTRYLVIRGQEILAVYEQLKSEGKKDFFHGYRIPITWEIVTKESENHIAEKYKELMPGISKKIKKHN